MDAETFIAAADVHPIPDGAADSAARLDTTDLLARLPLRQRAVAVLRFVEELPVAQVAELLGCSQGTVKSQAHHARTALRAAGLVQAAPASTVAAEQPPPSTHRGG